MSAAVKYLHSAMTGAPTLTGQVGTLIGVLDSCLVNGFGGGTLDSMSVSGNVATAVRAAGHPFEVDTVVEIAGATPAGLNGQKKVLSVTSTTYTFAAPGVADGPATGTITHKLAALGWSKEFAATNLAVYKSPNVAATGCRLRVDDTTVNNARVVGYETMSDVNTGTGPFPTAAQNSGGYFWPKSETTDGTARSWTIIGDDRLFYMFVNHGATVLTESHVMMFGDFVSKVSPDAYGCGLSAPTTNRSNQATSIDCFQCSGYTETAIGGTFAIPRSYTGLGSAIKGRRMNAPLPGISSIIAYSGNVGMSMPNGPDSGLYVVPYLVGDGSHVRGIFPGAYFVPHQIANTLFAQREKVTGIIGLPDRKLMAINNNEGPMFYDVTGPWR